MSLSKQKVVKPSKAPDTLRRYSKHEYLSYVCQEYWNNQARDFKALQWARCSMLPSIAVIELMPERIWGGQGLYLSPRRLQSITEEKMEVIAGTRRQELKERPWRTQRTGIPDFPWQLSLSFAYRTWDHLLGGDTTRSGHSPPTSIISQENAIRLRKRPFWCR